MTCAILGVAWSPDGDMIATGGLDQNYQTLESPRSTNQNYLIRSYCVQSLALVLVPDGQTIASASIDESLKLWSPKRCIVKYIERT
jgi:WD40 repeat protein